MNNMFEFFEVGGTVRDELLGLKSKDIDYVVVPDASLIYARMPIEIIFTKLLQHLKDERFTVFLVTPNCFTIRAKFPTGHIYEKTTADFVLARKEIGYKPGTREPIVEAGTLIDDLRRRDFTVNAMAKRANGEIIDPFRGQIDLADRVLRTPIQGEITFEDDPLRLLRAIRFAVTKGFKISYEIDQILWNYPYNEKFEVISEERIREELFKMFKVDTNKSLDMLSRFPHLRYYIFGKTNLWLKPTLEQ